MCRQENKANYFLAQRRRTEAECSNFWRNNLRSSCESGCDCLPLHLCNGHTVPGKMFQTNYILATNKTLKQLKTTNLGRDYSALT